MQYLSIELASKLYVISVREIDKLLSVPQILAEKMQLGYQEEHVVIQGEALQLIDLRKKLHLTPTELCRGSRLLIPRREKQRAILVELVFGLIDLNQSAEDSIIIDGQYYKKLDLKLL